jgi:ubiquinone/menaquinone biosynthesis C-methylase UbiE
MWKQGYQSLSRVYKNKDWKFMDYGYAYIDDPIEKLNLENIDEGNRFFIQLYHHVACAVNLRDLKVLDVGSGRGGGAEYIKRYLKPKTMMGVDFSENTVAFCNQNYTVNGLSFEIGNAESLPFKNNSFDVVINVESSHCYNSMDAFLGQVKRVLHEGGYFLFADFRDKKRFDILREQIYNSGLILIKETDITANVLEALNLDNERKTAEIEKKIGEALGLDNECKTTKIKKIIHKALVKFVLELTGAKGSNIFEKFQNREAIYLSFVLQKQTL